MESVAALSAAPGTLVVGGRPFAVLPPTPGDMLRVSEQMRVLAQKKCLSPVDYAAQHAHLPPVIFAQLLSEAIKLGAGNGAKPHDDAIWAEYTTLEGVRWRVWYHASKALPALAPGEINELVTDANFLTVADALNDALRFKDIDPKDEKKTPPTGGSSPQASTGPN